MLKQLPDAPVRSTKRITPYIVALLATLLLVGVGTGLASADPTTEPTAPSEPPSSDTEEAPPAEEWSPTENPKPVVIPGQMRSDREEVPEPFTKADADQAETMEARLQITRVAPGCQVYWPAPFEVCGAIKDKYNQMGGPNSFLLFPKSNELTNPGNTGKRTEFIGGNIYWSAATGAKPVAHEFLTKWGEHGYESGFLKYPTTDEIVLSDGGRRQEFQGGSIYFSFATGAHNIQGLIRTKWLSLGGTTGALKYPVSDELPVGGSLASTYSRMQHFQGQTTLLYNPTTGQVDQMTYTPEE